MKKAWSKFVTPTGKVVLTRRVYTEDDIVETAFWFTPGDADWSEMEEFCKRVGL